MEGGHPGLLLVNFSALTTPISFFKDFIYLCLEKGREKERERNSNVWLPLMCPLLGGQAHNPGMCPRLETEPATLWFLARAQSTELHQPGLNILIAYSNKHLFLTVLYTWNEYLL